MENPKQYTLMSSPRSGSTLIYFIVRWYLIKKFGYRDEHLGEYFNPYHYNLLYRDIFTNGEKTHKENIPIALQKELLKNKPGVEILNNSTIKAPPHKETFCISEQNTIKRMYDFNNLENIDVEIETQRRIALLKQDSNGKYFFKNHAEPLPEEAFDYLLSNYHFICIDRINKLEQYLSFAVANHTKIWMIRKNGVRPVIENNSLLYKKICSTN
ncbi:MAG: hypothetical protein HC836_22700 [Richelia sp. RM2_1_2]|nr:hypothetical protein [Richelia sp. RM2_1_2]